MARRAIGVHAISRRFEQESAEVVDGFERAMSTSVQYAADKPDEVRRILPTFTQIPEAAAERMRLAYFSLEERRDSLVLQMEPARTFGIIEGTPDPEELVRKPPA